jgi:hypothetical protein
MGVLRIPTYLLAAVFLAAGPGVLCEASDTGSFVLDWRSPALTVTGTAEITAGESGNAVRWQHEANLSALKRVAETFVRAMSLVRVDAYNTAQAVLLKEQDRNEQLYRYISGLRNRQVSYSELEVTIKTSLPLFGPEGFAPLLVSAGLDFGSFPVYDEYVFSALFTGLVVDARGLGRVPAIAPRILDEDHRVIFSKDLVDPASFARDGVVQYTSDPYYRGLDERVGNNPLKVVALADNKAVETDITISNAEAKTLLQNLFSRESLTRGRVIIVIDEEVIVQRQDYRF